MTESTLLVFAEWEKVADPARTGDPLWSVQAYRLSVYPIDSHTFDQRQNPQLCAAVALDQLTRAVGSISANIAEGYSRSSVADRARFYGYALGSTREAIAWYDTLRVALDAVVDARQSTLIQIRRLLLTTLKRNRPPDSAHNYKD